MTGANDMGPAFAAARRGACSSTCYDSAAHAVGTRVAAAVRRIRAVHGTPVTVVVLGYWNDFQDGAVGRRAYGAAGLALANRITLATDRELHSAAVATGAHYVSTWIPFKGLSGSIDPTPLLAADGDHPNARGHRVIARAVAVAVPRG
jgi:lysophospholipase L1-like esterase